MIAVVPAAARADEPSARAHYASGRAYYDQGRYEDALREFEEAFRAAPDPQKAAMVFNVAQAQERLGRIGDAVASFQRYLELSPNAEDRSTVEERIRTLQGRLAETGIVLTASEAGARVFVDGQDSGTTPLAEPIRVAPGSHEVRVEKEGFRPFRLRVSVEAGRRVEAEVSLVPVERTPVRGPEAAPAATRSGPGALPWVLVGVAGVATVGGSILGILALGKSDAASDERAGDRDLYDDERANAESLALFADISFGAAVVAAGVSVVLFVAGGSSPRGESPTTGSLRAAPMVGRGGAGLVVAGEL